MAKNCPECGAEVEYASRSQVVLVGRCSQCGTSATLLTESEEAAGASSGPSPVVGSARNPPAGGELPEFSCPECSETLTLHPESPQRIVGECEDCGTVAVYMLRRGDEERPARRGTEGPESPRGGPERPTRPCRRCGAPLRFSNDAEGALVGECDSCGNRFTLPNRREGRSGPGSGPRRFRKDREGDGGDYPARGRRDTGRRPGRPGFGPRSAKDRSDRPWDRRKKRPRWS